MKRTLTEAQKRIVAASFGWRCAMCAGLLDAAFQVDHILALGDGGTDDWDNLQPLHPGCHAAKTQREAILRAERHRLRRRQRKSFPVECTGCGVRCSMRCSNPCSITVRTFSSTTCTCRLSRARIVLG